MYGAVDPRTGAHFGMVCSRWVRGHGDDGPFLWWLSKEIKEDEHLLLLLDGAGWHKSKKLRVPTNITLKVLPPYSPGLNPVELVWQWLNQHHLANRVLNDPAQLEAACLEAWNTPTPNRIKSLCRAAWLPEN
jgi:hypothetical protein